MCPRDGPLLAHLEGKKGTDVVGWYFEGSEEWPDVARAAPVELFAVARESSHGFKPRGFAVPEEAPESSNRLNGSDFELVPPQ